MALGAPRARVIGLVARETLIAIGTGAAVAVPLAWVLGRLASTWLNGVLYGLSPTDGPTIGYALLVLTAVGSSAALLPARRAASADPMTALRPD
jgi:ABC-type antimicrobial peptide transport system permease subunit